MEKYLLIDGNNLGIRAAFGNEGLKNKNGDATGPHFGTIQSLLELRDMFPDHKFLIAWDGKSKRRMAESEQGVKDGLIPSVYKGNRDKENMDQPLVDFIEQSPFLQRGIMQLGISQVRCLDFEADDVIASYVAKLRETSEVVLVTTDRDYYQLLHDNVGMWDLGKKILVTKEKWSSENGIEPHEHVHVGALEGDTGDNIFGIPEWGGVTAKKYLSEHHTWEKMYEHFHSKYDLYREAYPDLGEDEISQLTGLETKTGKKKYPGVTCDMPFTGVVLAVENKRIKPAIPKKILMALLFEKRVPLAYSLKKMDDDIPDLPEISDGEANKNRFFEYLDYYDIVSLRSESEVFFGACE